MNPELFDGVKKIQANNVNYFYYIAHKNNLASILENGILPKNKVLKLKITSDSFANEEVQSCRHHKSLTVSNGTICNMHDLVPLFINPRNATLYSKKSEQQDLLILLVSLEIISDSNISFAFSDGNAASMDTKFYSSLDNLDKLDWDAIHMKEYMHSNPEIIRKKAAEFLLFPTVPPKFIRKILVYSEKELSRIKATVSGLKRTDISFSFGRNIFYR